MSGAISEKYTWDMGPVTYTDFEEVHGEGTWDII